MRRARELVQVSSESRQFGVRLTIYGGRDWPGENTRKGRKTQERCGPDAKSISLPLDGIPFGGVEANANCAPHSFRLDFGAAPDAGFFSGFHSEPRERQPRRASVFVQRKHGLLLTQTRERSGAVLLFRKP